MAQPSRFLRILRRVAAHLEARLVSFGESARQASRECPPPATPSGLQPRPEPPVIETTPRHARAFCGIRRKLTSASHRAPATKIASLPEACAGAINIPSAKQEQRREAEKQPCWRPAADRNQDRDEEHDPKN